MIDFSEILSEIGEIPNAPSSAWSKISRQSSRQVGEELDDGVSVASADAAINALVVFLNDLAVGLSLKISIHMPSEASNVNLRFESVASQIAEANNKIVVSELVNQIGHSNSEIEHSIEISNTGLVKIFGLTADLRKAISNAGIDEKKRARLLKRVDEFEALLTKKRITPTTAFSILALVGAGLAGTTSTLANAPNALETIGQVTAYLGIEKEASDEVLLITKEAEMLALPKLDDDQKSDRDPTP